MSPLPVCPCFIDVNLAQYESCKVLCYMGGATWLRHPKADYYLVVAGAPVEIRRLLTSNKTASVRAEVLPCARKEDAV